MVLIQDITEHVKLDNMRKEFVADVSHELKTPITSIKGYSELLTSGIPYSDEQKKEFLMRIGKETDNITNLINDILSISRIESGRGRKDKSEFNIKTMLEDLAKEFEPMIKENNIKLENIDIPVDIKPFSNIKIMGESSKIKIENTPSSNKLTYGLGEILEKKIEERENQK